MAGDGAELAGLLGSVMDSTGVFVPLALVAFLTAVGYVVLGAGLYAAHAVDWWMAVSVAIGAAALTVGAAVFIEWLAIAGGAVLLIGLASIGQMVLTEPDADWEHTPEYRGLHTMPGAR